MNSNQKTNQQKGREWEQELADRVGAEPVKGSGNQPFKKLDVEGTEFLLSAKWTDNTSLRLDSDTLQELREATRGPSGTGLVPLLAARIKASQEAGEKVYAVLELDDLLMLLQEQTTLFKESKREAKYREAKTPSLFRD